MELLPWYATAEVYCAVPQRHVTVRFLTFDGRHPIGVVSCSAFDDPTAPTCGTPCLGDEADVLLAADAPAC